MRPINEEYVVNIALTDKAMAEQESAYEKPQTEA
jgi:hypothetical protein